MDDEPEKLEFEKPSASILRPPAQAPSSSASKGPYVRTNDHVEDDQNLARWLFDNQTGLAFNLLALLFLTNICIPKARLYTSKFFMLSNYNTTTGKYAASFDDFYFMTFCIVLFTGLRAGVMDHILTPMGKSMGITKIKDVTRFSEQAWLLVYYSVFWPLGLYIYCNSLAFLNMAGLWTNWPEREMTGLMKGYVLAQWAFWIQQVLVINIEARRKDHLQMLTHHFITITLVSASYAYHQTRGGNLILVLMDVVDIFFPLAKCLKYLGYTTICDILFGLFVVSWLIARHFFYLMTCWSVYSDLPRYTSGCYRGTMNNLEGPFPVPDDWYHVIEPFVNPEGIVCWNHNTTFFFLACLLFLQAITIVWFGLIVRVAMRVIKGGSAEDIRSDDEAEEDEEENFESEDIQPLEEEVGVEDLDLKGWERRTGVKTTARSSGVSLRGHSDHKEFLNRIGCEKQID